MKHIYKVYHICECGKLLSHSQGDFDEWKKTCGYKNHKLYNISPEIYEIIERRLK